MADRDFSLPLLATKLHRPRLARDHLPRLHLLECLAKNVYMPLTLVSAPAGYGKSTLLSAWLETCDFSNGWLSLDESDNDLRKFLAYFLAAVQSQYPSAGNNTKALLKAPKIPPVSILTHTLVNELDGIGRPFILVLDDYHVLNDKNIHELIAGLLQHCPEPLHLVLSTRVDPPLPLAKYRARGQMIELRARDLRFSTAEAKAFLGQLISEPVDDAAAAVLEEKTEGWVTGLRLAALSVGSHSDLDRMIAGLPAENRYITDYLLAEVLSHQPPDKLEYLLTTAILDRFCAPLCDAVCATGVKSLVCEVGGQPFLDWLEQSDLFVVPLDDHGRWFRYHHLFHQLLRRSLTNRFAPDDISALQMRASRWFAENNLVDEALQYALAAGDHTAAAQLVIENRHAPLNEDKEYILEKWLSQLSEDIVFQRAELLLAKIWVLNYQFALWAIPPILEKIKSLPDRNSKEFPQEEIDLFDGVLVFWAGRGEHAIALLQSALGRTPLERTGIINEIIIYLAVSMQIAGQGRAAVQRFRRQFYDEAVEGPRKTRLLGAIALIQMLAGELFEAEKTVRQMEDMADRTFNLLIKTWSSYLQGIVRYQWNDLAAAKDHFSQALKKRFILDAGADIDSYTGLILSYQGMRQPDKALQAMDRMMAFAQDSGNIDYLNRAHSVQARLGLLQGDMETAVRCMEASDFSSDAGTMLFWLDVPRITQCRIMIERNSGAALGSVADKLCEHLKFSQATHNIPQTLELLLLQTRVFQKQGQVDKALSVLDQAVALAWPGGYIRPFLNMGSEMADLLIRLLKRSTAADNIRQILKAYDAYETIDEQEEPAARSDLPPEVRNQTLAKPLSDRELEILALLRQGLQNKEIATRLFISPETVKKHARNICGKLDSNTRQQAVAKAYQLGILTTEK